MKSGFSIYQGSKCKTNVQSRLAAISFSLVFALTLALGLGVGLAQAADSAEAANDTSTIDAATADDGAEGTVYEAGVVLVELKEGADEQETLEALSAGTGLEGIQIAQTTGDYVELALPDGVSVADAVETLAQSDVVDAVQPNFIYYLMDDAPSQGEGVTAADAAVTTTIGAQTSTRLATAGLQAAQLQAIDMATQAGGIAINDPHASKQWALESVRAYEAWETTQVNGSVTVAIIDNVFDVNHDDLKGNIIASYNAVTGIAADDITGENYVGPKKDHGTHVAGIVAAEANNAIGVAGVSYNAHILPIRIASDDGSLYTTSLVSAYDYILAHADEYNIRVVNMSMGAPYGKLVDGEFVSSPGWENTADTALLKAIDNAWDAGVVTVTAAGNAETFSFSQNGETVSKYVDVPFSIYPGDYDKCVNVINLRNTNSNDATAVARTSSSNYNLGDSHAKDIAAPGTSIYSTSISGSGNYVYKSGTSMASPCVAGVMALIFASNPSLTPAEAVSRLYSTATDLDSSNDGFDREYGYGEVNAYAAVTNNVAAITGTTTVAVGGTTKLAIRPRQSGTWNWVSGDESVVTVEGDAAGATVTGKGVGTTTVIASNDDPNDRRSALATITVYDPTIAGETTVTYGNTTQLALANANNPVGIWTWTSSNTAVATVGASTGVVTPVKPGTATITVTLNGNNAISSSVDVTVTPISLSKCSFAYTKRFVYAGHGVQPDDLVITYAGKRLSYGTDYWVMYANNFGAGTAKMIVNGIGNYEGTIELPFTIEKGKVTRATLSQTRFTYTGEACEPVVRAFCGSASLVEGSDFSVRYVGNIGAGTAQAIVEGIGNYSGTTRLSFTIEKAANTLKVRAKSPVVKRARLDVGKWRIARGKALAISGKKGALTYKKVKGSKRLFIGKKTGKITVRKNTPCGIYKIKVRVRAAGNANYKAATRTVVVKVRVK